MIQHEMQFHRPQGIRTLPPPHTQQRPQRQSPLQSPLAHSGSCLVILPYSRSAFRGTYFNAPEQEVNTCECTSFFMSPGDPEACLCGHPARCHGPGSRDQQDGDLDGGSNENRPRSRAEEILAAGGPGTYLPPVPLFNQPYSTRRKLSTAASESNQSPRSSTGAASPVYPSNGHSSQQQGVGHYYHLPNPQQSPQQQQAQAAAQAHQQCPAQITAILSRLVTLETQLSSTTHELNHLSAAQRHLSHAYNRLSTHTNHLSQELELIITKRGESARESLDLELLVQRQRKMADDVERINLALEALDERTEDLEFHSEDFERWMAEVNGRCASTTGGTMRGIKAEDDSENSRDSRRREDGVGNKSTAGTATTTTTTANGHHYLVKSVHVKIEDSHNHNHHQHESSSNNNRLRGKPILSLVTSPNSTSPNTTTPKITSNNTNTTSSTMNKPPASNPSTTTSHHHHNQHHQQQQQQQQQLQQVTVIAPTTPPMQTTHITSSSKISTPSSCKRRRSDSGVSSQQQQQQQQQIPALACLPSPPLSHGDIQLCVNKRSRTSQVLSA